MTRAPIDVADATALIRDTDTLGVPLGPGQPVEFLHALAARERFDDLQVYGALLVDLYEVFLRPGVRFASGFFGPAERFLRDSGAVIEYVPADFRRFTPVLAKTCPRVMATMAAPPDADGYVSLSLHAGATVGELHRAGADPERLLIVEVSPRFPRTFGLEPDHLHRLHLDEIDVLIESDRAPINLADEEATGVDLAIAEFVRPYIHDGSTLQTGIGAIPSTIARVLAESDGGDYGVHSEMFTTGLMHLHKAGKVTNARKGLFDGHSVTTFAAGTPELYEWIDGNPAVRFLPVEYVNSPDLIMQNENMVSINGALCIDLAGQVVADTISGHQFSGIGGHEDFIGGTGLDPTDHSFICLPSLAGHDEQRHSRIVAELPAGSIVTTPRHQVDMVVTEFGVAELVGKTVRQRAEALVAVAHPDARDELAEAAARIG